MIFEKTKTGSAETVAECLKGGGIAILPTDTVYGFSGIVDLSSTEKIYTADSRIRAIKGRSETKPLIQLIAKPDDIRLFTDDAIPESVFSAWPGALTVIVSIKEHSPLKNSPATVAFRCPGDAWLREVIAKCGAPIYSTSVNRSGQPVLDAFSSIEKEFGKEVDLIVNDGDKKGALPSTIIAIESGCIKVLRQGSVRL